MRLFNNMLFSAASIALTAGLVAYADPSIASVPQSTAPQVRVTYGDLDMQTAAGRTILDQRIRRAADEVCATGDATAMLEGASCRKQAIAEAHRAFDTKTADAGTPAVQVAVD